MRNLITTTAALVAIATLSPSCSTAFSQVGGVTSPGSGAIQCPLAVEKAYYGFEAGYNGVSQALNAAADNHILVKGTPASSKAKALYEKLIFARSGIVSAHLLCSSSLLTQVEAATTLIGDLQMLASGVNPPAS